MHNYKNTLMHIPKTFLTFINHAIKVFEHKDETTKTHRIVSTPLKYNFEVESTSYYRESNAL